MRFEFLQVQAAMSIEHPTPNGKDLIIMNKTEAQMYFMISTNFMSGHHFAYLVEFHSRNSLSRYLSSVLVPIPFSKKNESFRLYELDLHHSP